MCYCKLYEFCRIPDYRLFSHGPGYYTSLPFFMHSCIHKVQWIHRRQGAKAPKKIAIFPDNGNVGLCVCAKFHDHTYTVLCAHSSV